jgi:hypothetical protein
MSSGAWESLPEGRRADVLAAAAAVEAAWEPVPRGAFRVLDEPVHRPLVEECLALAGRTLIVTPAGYLSGYRDDVRGSLAAEGAGVLPADDRAVLVLVLLHGVAVPRSQGRLASGGLTGAVPVHKDELQRSKIPASRIRASLRRLVNAGILEQRGRTAAYVPGPQMQRLTDTAQQEIWEDLILLADPAGLTAAAIRRRRAFSTDNEQEPR